jgi:hypothetical protein
VDVLHESVRESTAQDSSKPVSVSEAAVTLPTENAVCYLASEEQDLSDNDSFLRSRRKCCIRGREGSGDAHNTLHDKCGRKDGAGATVQDGRYRNYYRPEVRRISWKSWKVLMPQELCLCNIPWTGHGDTLEEGRQVSALTESYRLSYSPEQPDRSTCRLKFICIIGSRPGITCCPHTCCNCKECLAHGGGGRGPKTEERWLRIEDQLCYSIIVPR